jgi:hypothetical protein
LAAARLPIKVLHLGYCKLITDVSVLAVIEGLPQIKLLGLAQLSKLTGDGKSLGLLGVDYVVIKKLVTVQSLETLDISSCNQIPGSVKDVLTARNIKVLS